MGSNWDKNNDFVISGIEDLIDSLADSGFLTRSKETNKYEISGYITSERAFLTSEERALNEKLTLLQNMINMYYYLFTFRETNIRYKKHDIFELISKIKMDPLLDPLKEILLLESVQERIKIWFDYYSSIEDRETITKDELALDYAVEIIKLVNNYLNKFIYLLEMIIKNYAKTLSEDLLLSNTSIPIKLYIQMVNSVNIGIHLELGFENSIFSRRIMILQDPQEDNINNSELISPHDWINIFFKINKITFQNQQANSEQIDFQRRYSDISLQGSIFQEKQTYDITTFDHLLTVPKIILSIIRNVFEQEVNRTKIDPDSEEGQSALKLYYLDVLKKDKFNTYSYLSLSQIYHDSNEKDKSQEMFIKGLEYWNPYINYFTKAPFSLIEEYLKNNESVSLKLWKNFVDNYESISEKNRTSIFIIANELSNQVIDLILLEKLHKYEIGDSNQILNRFEKYNHSLNERDLSIIATSCLRNLCNKTQHDFDWISKNEMAEGLERVVNLDIIIPLVIFNFVQMKLITVRGEKIFLTALGRSQCGSEIKLERGI